MISVKPLVSQSKTFHPNHNSGTFPSHAPIKGHKHENHEPKEMPHPSVKPLLFSLSRLACIRSSVTIRHGRAILLFTQTLQKEFRNTGQEIKAPFSINCVLTRSMKFEMRQSVVLPLDKESPSWPYDLQHKSGVLQKCFVPVPSFRKHSCTDVLRCCGILVSWKRENKTLTKFNKTSK